MIALKPLFRLPESAAVKDQRTIQAMIIRAMTTRDTRKNKQRRKRAPFDRLHDFSF